MYVRLNKKDCKSREIENLEKGMNRQKKISSDFSRRFLHALLIKRVLKLTGHVGEAYYQFLHYSPLAGSICSITINLTMLGENIDTHISYWQRKSSPFILKCTSREGALTQ